MNDVKWIKLTTTMFDNEKIKIIESLPAGDSILVVWIKLLTLAGKTNAGGYIYLTKEISYTDDMLASMFCRKLNIIILAMKTFRQFGMIEVDEKERIFIPNWDKHQNIDGLEKIREKGRLRQRKHRDKQTKLVECNVTSDATDDVTVTGGNALEKELEEELELEEDIKDIPPTPLPVAPNINPEITIFVKQFQEWALSEFGLSAEKITDSLITNGSDAVDKLIRIDGFSQEDVFNSIRWASNNHFWNDKIKSLSGIRKRASNEQMKFKNMFSDYEKRNSSGGSVRTDQNIKTAKSWADRKKKEMEANGQ